MKSVVYNHRKNLKKLLLLFLALGGAAFAAAQTGPAVSGGAANSAETVLPRVAELLSVSRYDEALALFDTIRLPERESSAVELLKASVLSSAGRYDEARTIAGEIVRKEQNNEEALSVLAAIEGASGRRRQQQSALERLIKIAPDNAEALNALGDISIRNHSLKQAASYFHRALGAEPDNAGALLGLGRTFDYNREWDEAEKFFNRAVELYPALAEARLERARFYRGRSFLVQALSDLDEAKKLNPGDYWTAIDRGSVLIDMNRRSQALEEFNRAVEINPDNFLAYVYSSGLKDDLGDHDGAGKDYEVLARLNPAYYYGLEGLGLHKMKDGQWAEARDAFLEAYRRAPEEHLYALLAAINRMRAENIPSPRQFLLTAMGKVKRDTLEWYMFRLYYDLTTRNYVSENDMVTRLDQEKDEDLKARMLFYMAQYYDLRDNTSLANKYYLMVSDLDKRAIPEWRLNEWIVTGRNLKAF